MKTEKVMQSIKNAGRKRMMPMIVDETTEFESASAAASFLGTSIQTIIRTANGSHTQFAGRIKFKKKEL